MMTRGWVVLLCATIGIGAATWLLGWWGVPLIAFAVGALQSRRSRIAQTAALAAVIAWLLLLEVNAVDGGLYALTQMLSGVLQRPAWLLIVVTLLFSALLGWSAAVIGAELGRVAFRSA